MGSFVGSSSFVQFVSRMFAGRTVSADQPAPARAFDDSERRSFLPDSDVDPVRPGSPEERARLAERAGAIPAPPEKPPIDEPAEVSYVLGSFNRRRLLERAVSSIRADCAGLKYEIIVVDGGSDDGSIEWICAQKDIIGVIQHNRYVKGGEKRRRMSWGRFMNIGFRAASAPWIAMISDDCYLLPGSTKAALERVAAAQAAGMRIGGCAFYYRNWPSEDRYYVQRTLGGNLMVNHGLYSRAALIEVGYANEDDYAFYKADSDLSLKIWAAGYAITDCEGALCEHFMGPDEEVRASNNEVMERDRRAMHARWPGLVGKISAKMGRIHHEHVDPYRTAERVFGDLLPNDDDDPADMSKPAWRERGIRAGVV